MRAQSVLGLLLVLFLQNGGSTKLVTEILTSTRSGSAFGEQVITVVGQGFAEDQYTQTNYAWLDAVDGGGETYQLTPFSEDSTETQAAFRTPPMRYGTFKIRMKVDSEDVEMCKADEELCIYKATMDSTPSVTDITPFAGPPGETYEMTGQIFTLKISGSDGVGNKVKRIFKGGRPCNPYTDITKKSKYGHYFLNDTTTYGVLKCRDVNEDGEINDFIENGDFTFLVEGYGRNSKNESTKRISSDDQLYMVQTYGVITGSNISPKCGSTAGKTKLVIPGITCTERSYDYKIYIGGDECTNPSCSDNNEITCDTPSQPVSRSFYPGGRGGHLHIWKQTVGSLSDILALPQSGADYSSSWTDVTEYDHATDENAAVMMEFLFKPLYNGPYRFKVLAVCGAEVYFSDKTSDPAASFVKVASMSDDQDATVWQITPESEAKTLKTDGTYLMRVLHQNIAGKSCFVKVGFTTTVANHLGSNTKQVLQEKQQIKIARPSVLEKQKITFTQCNEKGDYDITVFEFTLVEGDYNVYFKVLGVATESVYRLKIDAKTLREMLQGLSVFRGQEYLVEVEEDNSKFTVKIKIGNAPLMEVIAEGTTVVVTKSSAKENGDKYVHLQLGTVLIPGFKCNAPAETVQEKLGIAAGVNCPSSINASPDTEHIEDFEEDPEMNHGGHSTTVDSFSGRRSRKNPYILLDFGPARKSAASKTLCFAYKGELPKYIHVKAFSTKGDVKWTKDSTALVIPTLSEHQLKLWQYTCVDVDKLTIHPDVEKIYLSERTKDVLIDAISFFKKKTTPESIDKILEKQYPAITVRSRRYNDTKAAVEDTAERLKSITVAKNGDAYEITIEAHNCGYEFPLLKPAFGTVESDMTIEREVQASGPTQGTFSTTFEGFTAEISLPASHKSLAADLNPLGLGELSVSSNIQNEVYCRIPEWDVTMTTKKGDQEQIQFKEGSNSLSDNAMVTTSTLVDGQTNVGPMGGDLISTYSDKPQVLVTVDGIPSKCDGDCTFEFCADKTPSITSATLNNGEYQINGEKFSTVGKNTVTFGTYEQVCTANSATLLTCAGNPDLPGGEDLAVSVHVEGSGQSSNSVTMTLTPSGVQLSPTTGPANGGAMITVTAKNWYKNPKVYIGTTQVPERYILNRSQQSIVFASPKQTAGEKDIIIKDQSGNEQTNAGKFNFDASMNVGFTGVDLTYFKTQGGQTFTVVGTNLGDAAGSIKIDDEELEVVEWTATKIVAKSVKMADGSYNLIIKKDGTTSVAADADGNLPQVTYRLEVTNYGPRRGSILGGTVVTVMGKGFDDTCKVSFGDIECNTDSVEDEKLICVIGKTGVTKTVENKDKDGQVSYNWNPSQVNIQIGDSVKWEWKNTKPSDQLSITETENAKSITPNGFMSPTSNTGSFEHPFNKAGKYYYATITNGEVLMRGEVIVTARDDFSKSLNLKCGDYEAAFRYSANQQVMKRSCSQVTSTCTGSVSTTENTFEFKQCAMSKITTGSSVIKTESSVISATDATDIELTGDFMSLSDPCQIKVYIGGKLCTVSKAGGSGVTVRLNSELEIYQEYPLTAKFDIGTILIENFIAVKRMPVVSSITPREGSEAGGAVVTITGTGFKNVQVAIGNQECMIQDQTQTTVTCKTAPKPAGTTGNSPIKIYVHAQKVDSQFCNDCDKGYRYIKDAQVTSMTGISDIGNEEKTVIEVNGDNFGTSVSGVSVKFGETECNIKTVTAKKITCEVNCIENGEQAIIVSKSSTGNAVLEMVQKTVKCAKSVRRQEPETVGDYGGTVATLYGCGLHEDFEHNTATVVSLTSACEAQVQYPYKPAARRKRATGSSMTPVINSVVHTANTKQVDVTVTTCTAFSGSTVDVFIGRGTFAGNSFPHNHQKLSVNSFTNNVANTGYTCLPAGNYHVLIQAAGCGYSQVKQNQITHGLTLGTVAPSSGSTSGSYEIALTGTGYYNGHTTVKLICGGTAHSCPVKSTPTCTSLSCEVPAIAASTLTACNVEITVADPSGVAAAVTNTFNNQFSIDPSITPSVTQCTPTPLIGGTGGGTDVTITGTNFGTSTSNIFVTIDGVTCVVKTTTNTQVVCDTGAHAASGTYDIKVKRGSGGHATFTATGSQSCKFEYADLFSSPFTWGGASNVPTTGSLVEVKTGQTLVIDQTTPVLKMLLIKGGHVKFTENCNSASPTIYLKAEYILIMAQGSLSIGTETKPYQCKAIIELHGTILSPELPIYGAKVLAVRNGTLDLHGKITASCTWCLLKETAKKGDTQIKLQCNTTTWEVDSEIIIATTGDRHSMAQTEKRKITAISSDGSTLTLDKALDYEHLGETATYPNGATVEFRAEVGLLTRNVKVQGALDSQWDQSIPACPTGFDPGEFATQTCFDGRHGAEKKIDEFGGQIMFHPASKQGPNDFETVIGRIESTELRYVGQANRMGRYPIHFHLIGFNPSSYVKRSSIHETNNRVVNIHGTHNITIKCNVAYKTRGGAFFMEDGIEQFNEFSHNFIAFFRSSTSLLNDDITPAAFWATNPRNIHTYNHAAGGTHFGFWYRMHEHPDGPSFDATYCPRKQPLLEFSHNVAHSCGWFGLWVFQDYYPVKGGTCSGTEPEVAVFQDFVSWNSEKGAEFVNCGAVQFSGGYFGNNEKTQIEGKFIHPLSGYYYDNGQSFVGATLAETHSALTAPSPLGAGLTLPIGDGGYVKDVTFIGFGGTNAAITQAVIDGTCKERCGGYSYWFSGLKFYDVNSHAVSSSTSKVKFDWQHAANYVDLDGTLTGKSSSTSKPTCVMPTMSWLNPSLCTKDTTTTFRPTTAAAEASICDEEECNTVRFAFNEIQPPVMEGKDALTRRDGYASSLKVPSSFKKKRTTNLLGWMFILVANNKYELTFNNSEHTTNFSYSGRVSGLKDENTWVTICSKMDFKPDVFQLDGTDAPFSSNPLTPASPNFGWHFDSTEKETCYMVKGSGSSPTKQEITFSLNSYKCVHSDCKWPDPSKLNLTCSPTTGIKTYWNQITDWAAVRGCTTTDAACVSKPTATDELRIAYGQWIVFDKSLTQVTLKKLVIEGTLEVENDAATDLTLTATYIHVLRGTFLCGCGSNHFKGKFNIELEGDTTTAAMPVLNGPPAGAKTLMVNGIVSFIGPDTGRTWAGLAQSADKGTNKLYLTEAVPWSIGAEIVIPGTNMGPFGTELNEILSSTTVNSKTVLTLKNNLQNNHIAKTSTATNAKYHISGGVGLLSRRINIFGKTYADQDKEGFGGRMMVSRVDDVPVNGGKHAFTGHAVLRSVGFQRMGQLGFNADYDPRYALTFASASSNDDLQQSVHQCSFKLSYSPSIGVYDSKNVSITESVLYRSVGAGIVTTSEDTTINRVMSCVSLHPQTYNGRSEKALSYMASIDTRGALRTVIKDSTVSGSERCGYLGTYDYCDVSQGEYCTGVTSATVTPMYNTVFHSNLMGTCLLADDSWIEDTNQLSILANGITAFRNWDYGIYIFTKLNVKIANSIVIDNGAGISTFIQTPDVVKHETKIRVSSIENCVIEGRIGACETDGLDESMKLFKFSPNGRGPDVKGDRGQAGIVITTPTKSSNAFPNKPGRNNMGYSSATGDGKIKNTTMDGFRGDNCGGSYGLIISQTAEDFHAPTVLENVFTGPNTHHDYKLWNAPPLPGSVNPSDCVDMACDGNQKWILTDLSGTYLPPVPNNLGASTISRSGEQNWRQNNVWGLTESRLPTRMWLDPLSATPNQKLPLTQVMDEFGLPRPGCQFQTNWNNYLCDGYTNYRMLVFESLDHDTELRRLSPVGISVKLGKAYGGKPKGYTYVDLLNGPQDHGWCAGYTCQKRLSIFYAVVRMEPEDIIEIYLSSTTPQNMRFRILNAQNAKLNVRLYIKQPHPVKLTKFPEYSIAQTGVPVTYIAPKNAVNGQLTYLAVADYPNAVTDPCGTNYREIKSQMLHFVLCSGYATDISIQNVVVVGLKVMTLDQFFDVNHVTQNLATFLGIPASKINLMNPIQETRRKKRDTSAEITIYYQIGDQPVSETDSYTYSDLVELATTIINAIQTGNISTALNVTINSMSVADVLPPTTDPNWATIAASDNFLQDLKVPDTLVFDQEPVPGTEGNPFTTPARLHFLDEDGNRISLLGSHANPWKVQVALRVGSGTNSHAYLSGTTEVSFSDGYANFTDLALSHNGTGYILDFTVSYPSSATFTLASQGLSVAQRSLKVVVVSTSSATVYQGSSHALQIELHDKDTGIKLNDVAWNGAAWNVAITKSTKSSYTGAMTGTTSGVISPVSSLLTVSDLTLDSVGIEVVTVTVTSSPAGYSLAADHTMTLYHTDIQNIAIETTKTMTLKVSGDYSTLGTDAFAAALVNKLMPLYPEVKFSNPVHSQGSIMVTVTVEGSTTAVSNMTSAVCSGITSGIQFTYSGSSYSLSSSLKVDGTEQYGVSCELAAGKDERHEDDDDDDKTKTGIIVGSVVGAMAVILLVVAIISWKMKVYPKTKTHKMSVDLHHPPFGFAGHDSAYLGSNTPAEDILWRENSFMSIKDSKMVPAISTSYEQYSEKKRPL